MALRPLKSFFPNADALLAQDLPTLGEALLQHLKSYEGLNTVYQHGGLNRGNFRAMLENQPVGLGPLPKEPEYGARQPEVTARMMEAWNWLDKQGLLIRDDQQPADWFNISSEGKKLLENLARYERWEKLGVDQIKQDLLNGGTRVVGGPPENHDAAWEWVRRKENKPPIKRVAVAEWELIAPSRLEELRALKSPAFDFTKLIRLCEELNITSREECPFAIGMLTRALLDHVPPLFGVKSFDQLASYSGGNRSFKDTMFHLDTAAKKIADGFLHTQIRRKEILPTPQQVNFGPALDVLLGEIVRITT